MPKVKAPQIKPKYEIKLTKALDRKIKGPEKKFMQRGAMYGAGGGAGLGLASALGEDLSGTAPADDNRLARYATRGILGAAGGAAIGGGGGYAIGRNAKFNAIGKVIKNIEKNRFQHERVYGPAGPDGGVTAQKQYYPALTQAIKTQKSIGGHNGKNIKFLLSAMKSEAKGLKALPDYLPANTTAAQSDSQQLKDYIDELRARHGGATTPPPGEGAAPQGSAVDNWSKINANDTHVVDSWPKTWAAHKAEMDAALSRFADAVPTHGIDSPEAKALFAEYGAKAHMLHKFEGAGAAAGLPPKTGAYRGSWTNQLRTGTSQISKLLAGLE